MRKILVLILLICIIYPVKGVRRQIIYSKATPSDEGIYLYFSEVLKDAGTCLDKFLNENSSGVNLSLSLYHKIKLTEEEYRFYTARGVKSNVSKVIGPFISLSVGVKRLIHFQSIFLKNIKILFKNSNNYYAYLKAESAVVHMKLAADKIGYSINEIERIELWNGSSELYFNVSELKTKLKDVYKLISYYDRVLAKFEREGFVVVVSNDHPFLYQEITIYVYARNVTPTALFIDNIRYVLKNNTMKYSFKELGEHVIYAEGISNGKLVRSNTVKVYVSKIPTCIILSPESTAAFLNEKVEIRGLLLDYYNNPIQANVTVKIDGKEYEFSTHNGFFSFNVTRSSEGFLNVSAFYAGNGTYESSNASISIFFSRFPISLYIEANRTRVNVNETVEFVGSISGINYTIPIRIFVNSSNVKTINATKKFNFTLNFSNPGTYLVFAYFPGDSLHKPAKSNKVLISVGYGQGFINRASNVPYFLLVVITVAAVAVVLIRRKRTLPKTEHVEEKKEQQIKVEKTEKISEESKLTDSVEDAYKTLFSALVDRYNLKKSLTPRELFKALKDESFAEKLKVITDIHEKAVYGEVKLKDDEKIIYFKLIRELLEEIR